MHRSRKCAVAALGAATALLGPAALTGSARAAIPGHSGHAFLPPRPTPDKLELFAQGSAPLILQLTPAAPRAADTKGAAKRRDLLAARAPSRTPHVSTTNSSSKTRVAYVNAYLGRGMLDGRYSLRASLTR